MIHHHGYEVLTPKGPCPVVTERLTTPSLPTLSFLLFPCWLSTKQKKKRKEKEREKKKKLGVAAALPSHCRTTSSTGASLKNSSHFNFFLGFYFYYHHYYYSERFLPFLTHMFNTGAAFCRSRCCETLGRSCGPPGSIKAHCGTGT